MRAYLPPTMDQFYFFGNFLFLHFFRIWADFAFSCHSCIYVWFVGRRLLCGAFFWQNVAIYVLFCKNIDIDAIFWQNVAIYALFSRFRPNSQKLFPVPPLSFYQPWSGRGKVQNLRGGAGPGRGKT